MQHIFWNRFCLPKNFSVIFGKLITFGILLLIFSGQKRFLAVHPHGMMEDYFKKNA
jgi:hypothetical protein